MKLYYKVTLINAFTRILIVVGFLVFTPGLIYKTAVSHTDARLERMQGQILRIVNTKGIGEFLKEEDTTFFDYTVLKEKFIYIQKIDSTARDTIVNSERPIEEEVLE